MNHTAHSDLHESLLHEVVTGDRAASDPRVATMLSSCEECRARLDELTSVSSLLDLAAREERQTLAGLDWSAAAPGESRIAPLVRAKVLEASRERKSAKLRRLGLPVLAAAAGICAVVWLVKLLRMPKSDAPRSMTLGENLGTGMHPAGAVAGFGAFTWTLRAPEGGWYSIRVEEDGGDGKLLAAPPDHLTIPQWIPDPKVLETWPREIRWWVDVHDSTGGSKSYSERAWLSDSH